MITKKPTNVHFLGIFGSGMKPLAEIALQTGYQVTGSDMKSMESQSLSGIKLGHHADNIPEECDILVFSSAIPPDNPELQAARSRSIPCIHRSEFLKLLSEGKKLIAITGTHGKTTTTALTAHILNECGLSPTACLGGEFLDHGKSSLVGTGDYFVAELDESDGTILNFQPFLTIINNIDLDHLDYYEDLDDIKQTFIKVCHQTDKEGFLVFGWDNPHSREVGLKFDPRNRLAFGKKIGCDIRGISFEAAVDGSRFTAMVEDNRVYGTLPFFGDYNFKNVLGALSIARALDIDVQQAAKALSSFPGVKRRLNCLFSGKKLKIFDDYAHNPGKIRSVIEALRQTFSTWQIVVVFQPHRYTRITKMYQEFASSFVDADMVLVADIFAAGEQPITSYRGVDFANELQQRSHTLAHFLPTSFSADTIFKLCDLSKSTVILTVGAGDIDNLAHDLRKLLNEKKIE